MKHPPYTTFRRSRNLHIRQHRSLRTPDVERRSGAEAPSTPTRSAQADRQLCTPSRPLFRRDERVSDEAGPRNRIRHGRAAAAALRSGDDSIAPSRRCCASTMPRLQEPCRPRDRDRRVMANSSARHNRAAVKRRAARPTVLLQKDDCRSSASSSTWHTCFAWASDTVVNTGQPAADPGGCICTRPDRGIASSLVQRTSWGTRPSCRSASPRNGCRSPARGRRTPPPPTPRGVRFLHADAV
jgi:hypothetical protein